MVSANPDIQSLIDNYACNIEDTDGLEHADNLNIKDLGCKFFSQKGAYCGTVDRDGKPHGKNGYFVASSGARWDPISGKAHWANGYAFGFFRIFKPGFFGDKKKIDYFHNGER